MKWLELDNKVVIVTGGASGIGNIISQKLNEQNANVIIADRQIETNGPIKNGYGIHCDVTNHESVEDMVNTVVQKYGNIDILVNNAGISLPGLLVDDHSQYEMDEYALDKIINVNVKGSFFCAQEAARIMKKNQEGVIVNISSECGKEDSFGQSIYSASKSAIDSLTRSWAKELGKDHIRVVAVAPGPMEETTLFSDHYLEALCYCRNMTKEEFSDNYARSTLLNREGHLEEVANLVLFLSSNKASFITGTTINISGGKSRG